MAHYDLLKSFISKLALPRGSRGLQREAHYRKLGCSRKGGGRAKNIYIRKISKQKIYMEQSKKKIYIYIYIYYFSLNKKSFAKKSYKSPSIK